MAKAEQALILDPSNELHFKGPFSEVTTTYLKLTNPTDRQIGFKVKTTAPKTYCVRPTGGVILPKETIPVAVMLQPFDPDTDDRSKDKFMVQSMFVPEGQEFADSMWHDVPPEGLMNSKLKCIFYLVPEAAQVLADIVETLKPKSKPTHVPETKASDVEVESKKLHDEYKKLKAELNELRQENSALKEEGIRTRMAYGARTKATSARPESESHQPMPKKQMSYNYLIGVSVLILLLGIYLGKVIL